MNLNTGGWASRALTPLLRIIRGATNATVPVVVISEPVNSETAALVNADIALVAKGTGATLAQVPDGTVAGGDKRGSRAIDWQRIRTAATQVASGSQSFIGSGQQNTASEGQTVVVGGNANLASGNQAAILGGNTNTASGIRSCAVAGFLNTASGSHSYVGGGESNTASSDNSFIGGGQSNTVQTNSHATVCGGISNIASGSYSFVGGGNGHLASASYSAVVGGQGNSSTGNGAIIAGGYFNLANGAASFVAGGRYGTTRSIIGYHVFPACYEPIAGVAGVTQSGLLLLGRQTTDATATVLTSNTSAAGTTNQVILPNNSAYSFSGEVIAGVTGGGNTARWTINGAIKRGAGAGTTAMVGTPTVTMTHNDAGAAAWTVAITADTTNGGIKVEVTGAASTTIRWVAKITTTEMTF